MKSTILFTSIALIFGYILGLRHGRTIAEEMNSSIRAAFISFELDDLKNGKVSQVIEQKEIELDVAISIYRYYDESLYKYIWPDLNEVLDDAIIEAVNYRYKNPYDIEPIPEGLIELYPEEKRELIRKDNLDYISDLKKDKKIMIERYSTQTEQGAK
ncbi:MAG: hypothetical protein P8Y12_04665 [Gammaproteobacteria bacterium]|jgi:hypothetical protein